MAIANFGYLFMALWFAFLTYERSLLKIIPEIQSYTIHSDKSNTIMYFQIPDSTRIVWVITEYTPRAVIWLVNTFDFLAYDWTVKIEWKVAWHDHKRDVVQC